VQVGDLVVVNTEGLRPLTGELAVVIEMQPRNDAYGGTVFYCHALMAKTQETYKFRIEHLDVVS
jgi:hypothetical protein